MCLQAPAHSHKACESDCHLHDLWIVFVQYDASNKQNWDVWQLALPMKECDFFTRSEDVYGGCEVFYLNCIIVMVTNH